MKKISKVLNKQYKKHFTIEDMERFSLALENHISNINDSKSEEDIKSITKEFFKATFYQDYNITNQDDQNKKETDQLIYNKDGKLNVILEYKKLSNKNEMLTQDDVNKKALHEICLYYFDTLENHNEIRHIIITNGLDFYIVDSHDFYTYFEGLKSTYTKFIEGKLNSEKHGTFYDIVSEYITQRDKKKNKDGDKFKESQKLFCYFNLKEESKTDVQLKNLYKVLHPNHLLKEYRVDDANSLNKDFYNELLYIIGLKEKKKGGVLLLEQNNNEQSLIGLSMYALEDKISSESKRYDTALELSLLWINRILFLKLVESYIVSINNSDTNLFFTKNQLDSFSKFNTLFFNILGKKEEDRRSTDKEIFPHAPYLNSSLFELSPLEDKYFTIAILGDEPTALYGNTILKTDKKNKKKLTTPHYIVKFINAFDYSTTEDSSDSTKQMINPAILGKVFEKINGYKDGAVFTPAYITEYMAKVSIEKVIVNKFKEVYQDETITDYDDVHNIIDDKQKANDIINSIKICDPSVGSGHFLVACLNEILKVKSKLRILLYTYDSKRIIRDYTLHIENDDLVVEDEDGEIFTYKKGNTERQDVQEALFREKRIIIENCLFGVDLNSKSVEICKLRLWIELLKSTYYHRDTDNTLETLPNIDINIKVGDALISEYAVQVDKSVLGDKRTTKSKLIKDYKKLVESYKESKSKTKKRETNEKLTLIKEKIRSNIQADLFETDKPLDYNNALEWMLEFPEVWDDQAVFKGFDLIIGNPPYIQLKNLKNVYDNRNFHTHLKTGDIYALFYEQGFNLLTNNNGILCYVTSNKWLRAEYGKPLRGFITTRTNPNLIIDLGSNAFDNVSVDTNILMYTKGVIKPSKTPQIQAQDLSKFNRATKEKLLQGNLDTFDLNLHKDDKPWTILESEILSLKTKIEKYGTPLKDWDITIKRGVQTGCNEAFIIDTKTKDKILSKCLDDDERERTQEIIKPILRGEDIKRYIYKWADLWLINTHNGTKTTNRIEIENGKYQTLYKHLSKFKSKAIKRHDKGESWANLRNCAYLEDFEKEKILFPRIIQEQSFILTNDIYYEVDTANIITGEHLPYLLAFLNSNIVYTLFKLFYEGGGISGEIKLNRLEMIPIPKLDLTQPDQQDIYDKLTSYGTQMQLLHQNKQENQSAITTLDKQINTLIYQLYNFTKQEIKLLEKGI